MTSERWAACGALVLFGVSLFLPAIDGSGFPAMTGLDVLRQGAGAIRSGVVAWYANPVLLLALGALVLGRFKYALALALLATLLALSSFAADGIAERAGRSVPAFGFAIGFYVWLLAFPVSVAAAVGGIYKVSKCAAAGSREILD